MHILARRMLEGTYPILYNVFYIYILSNNIIVALCYVCYIKAVPDPGFSRYKNKAVPKGFCQVEEHHDHYWRLLVTGSRVDPYRDLVPAVRGQNNNGDGDDDEDEDENGEMEEEEEGEENEEEEEEEDSGGGSDSESESESGSLSSDVSSSESSSEASGSSVVKEKEKTVAVMTPPVFLSLFSILSIFYLITL